MRAFLGTAVLAVVLSIPHQVAGQTPGYYDPFTDSRSGTWCLPGGGSTCYTGSWSWTTTWDGDFNHFVVEYETTGTWSSISAGKLAYFGWEVVEQFSSGATVSYFIDSPARSSNGVEYAYTESFTSPLRVITQGDGGLAFLNATDVCGASGAPACEFTPAVAVPEPGTLALLATGLLGLFGVGLGRGRWA